MEWTPRLRKAVALAKGTRPELKVLRLKDDPTLLMDRKAQKITDEEVKSTMSRLKLEKKAGEESFWSLHLLKHKGQTDTEDKRLSGHKHERMKALYDHQIDTVKPAG